MKRARLFLILGTLLTSFASAAACSSSSGTSGTGDSDAGDGGGDATISGPSQKGRIVVALQESPLGGATIAIAGKSVTAAKNGTYQIEIPKGTPLQMVVTAEDYYKLYEQEYVVKSDLFDRGDTSLLSKSVADVLLSLLPGRDATKGLLIVHVIPTAPCDSEEGSTVALDPPGTSQVRYITNGAPSNSLTSVKKGEAFSAVIYNIDPGAPVAVKVNSPLCKQQAFPVEADGVTYTGQNQKVEGGEVLSFQRVYLNEKAPPPADAGTD